MISFPRTANVVRPGAALLTALALWLAVAVTGPAAVHAAAVDHGDVHAAVAPQEEPPPDEEDGLSDRDLVMLVTAGAAITLLVLATIGYAYRRAYGIEINPHPEEESRAGGHH